MATTTTTLTLTVTAPTQAEANQKSKAAAVDCIKQNLANLNARLRAQAPDPAAFVNLTTADVDAANVATLTKWLTTLVRDWIVDSARAQRVNAADAANVQPVRVAPPGLDVVP